MKNCKVCDEAFTPKRSTNVYCSEKCRIKENSKHFSNICTLCKQEFKGLKQQKVCSWECHKNYHGRS